MKSKKKGSQKTKLTKPVKAVMKPTVMIDDKAVSDAVSWINGKVADTIDKGARGLLEIGQYIFRVFFHDNPDEVRLRGRQRPNSFRSLANHPELQLNSSSLYNSVQLAIQEKLIATEGVLSIKHFTPTHRIELLRVKDSKEKLRFVAEVAESKLSVRQLRVKIDALYAKALPPANPEPSDSDGPKTPKLIRDLLAIPVNKVIKAKRVSTWSPTQKRHYRGQLERAVVRLQEMIKALDAVK